MTHGTGPHGRGNSDIHQTDKRKQTRRIVFIITAILAVLTLLFFIWSLRPIILPAIVGMFVAYLCFPVLKLFTKIGIPRAAGILLLFGTFFIVVMVVANLVGAILPNEKEQLVLRTRFQYKLNERYHAFMGISKQGDTGNIVYKYLGDDLDHFMGSINAALSLNREERMLFMKYRIGYNHLAPIKDKYYEYFLKNTHSVVDREQPTESAKNDGENKTTPAGEDNETSPLAAIMAAFKLWIIMPLVFLFLLIDDGEIKRFFVALVPNRYFEVSLAVFDKVNKAIGNYLRGILMECSLVGLSYAILLSIFGFEIKMAVMIGLFAGIANAIPLMGAGIALACGASYALIAENVNSVLPFITADNLILAVLVCVIIVMAMDNVIFQPFVVGGAVQIHPLAVFLGIIGGSMLFGFAGLILAIPTIVVVKEFIATLFTELKDYYII
ncbi:MAG: AI-2E family transporter [Spirochaetes bacterium]|nr:AI-2E family transporter [Spirochaetota bacterium]